MRKALLTTLVLGACVSAPSPKAPDESHRVPVNRIAPPEATAEGSPEKPARRVPGDGGVEWR